MGISKIQIGQLWKKEGTSDTYLVTRVYSEALYTMVVLRKSGAEDQARARRAHPHRPQYPRFLPRPGRRALLTLPTIRRAPNSCACH
jgi:hypothetical protein